MSHQLLQKIATYTCSIILLSVLALAPAVNSVAHAFLFGGGGIDAATRSMQVAQQVKLSVSAAANTTTAASTATSAGLDTQSFGKDFVLDGLAFSVAKNMVSQMTQSLLNWINGGFDGSPKFVSDLNQMLLTALDETAGEYISGLGGVGEFICSPFQLDVQAALTINYAQARSGMPSGPDAPGCRLSDIGNNVENFLGGVAEGGLDDWLTITSNPQNTPYGAYLAAEASLNMRLRNEAGQEIELASWGDGFMSQKICEAVEGSTAQNCTITTPGKVISEALTFQLSTGPRALIEADEINEIIGALINQLALQALEGVNGMLGLTAGTGYTDYGYDPSGEASIPYIDAARSESVDTGGSAATEQQITRITATEQSFSALITEARTWANTTESILDVIDAEQAAAPDPSEYDPTLSTTTVTINGTDRELGDVLTGVDEITRADIAQVRTEANQYEAEITENLALLNQYRSRINSATEATQPTIALEFLEVLSSGAFHSESLVEQKRVEWQSLVRLE